MSKAATYYRLFDSQLLDDPFNQILRQRLFDPIPNTIYVNRKGEIKADLVLVNHIDHDEDFKQYFKERQGQMPEWVVNCQDRPQVFKQRLYAISDFLYDINALGSLCYVSKCYFMYTDRNIKDYISESNEEAA